VLTQDNVLVLVIPALVIAAGLAIRGRYGFWKTLLLLVGICYAGAVIALTMLPLPVDPRLIATEAADGFLHNNFVPFATISSAFDDGPEYFLLQVIGNIALLAPFGLLLPLIWQRARHLRIAVACIVVAAAAIEVAQLAVSSILGYTYRQADIDDLIMNVLGGLLGYALCLVWRAARAGMARYRAGRAGGRMDGVTE